MKIFFSFYHVCGYSLIKYPGCNGKTRLTHLSGVGFQVGNFLVVAIAYIIGIYQMPEVRTFGFKDVSHLNTMLIYHCGYAVSFLSIFESWYHRDQNKVFLEHFERIKIWLTSQKCSKFYDKSKRQMSYQHLIVTLIALINETLRNAYNAVAGGDLSYYYYVIIIRFMVMFRWLHLLLYTRLILLQHRSVLELVRMEKNRITTKFYLTLVSQINTKLFFMGKAMSIYFGWSFILISLICLLQVSFAMYICALHFMYDEYPDVIPSKNSLF